MVHQDAIERPVTIYQPFIGRFGNNLFQYAYARKFAEEAGAALLTDQWSGEQVFDINHERPNGQPNLVRLSENYRQRQEDLIYSRADVKAWLKFKPAVQALLEQNVHPVRVASHRRSGDYHGYGYPTVSRQSYRMAFDRFGIDHSDVVWITEEEPLRVPGLPDYLPDFYRIMTAEVVFRGNSTFSWWAVTLGNAKKVYAPVIENLEGTKDHDGVLFVEGNWPRCAAIPACTDLHLRET